MMRIWTERLLEAKRPTWQEDLNAPSCSSCSAVFTYFRRRHHCRACGLVVCDTCAPVSGGLPLPALGYDDAVRVCPPCMKKQSSGGPHLGATSKSEGMAVGKASTSSDACKIAGSQQPDEFRRTTASSSVNFDGTAFAGEGWQSMCSSNASEDAQGTLVSPSMVGDFKATARAPKESLRRVSSKDSLREWERERAHLGSTTPAQLEQARLRNLDILRQKALDEIRVG